MESLTIDEEVEELLKNYKHKRTSLYEPCTVTNIKDCLIGLAEELTVFNINFLFDPFVDIADGTIKTEALINLINAAWNLLQKHKNALEKSDLLKEQNHFLEKNNKQLLSSSKKLNEKIINKENESRACVSTAQKISDHYDSLFSEMKEAHAKLTQLSKQKNSTEKNLQHEITRLKSENQKLLTKLQNKSGSFTSCSEICGVNLLAMKEREKKQKAIIEKLQDNNRELLQQLLHLKEELILTGLHDISLNETSS